MFIHGEAPRNRFEDSKVIWGSAPVSETFICTFISCYVYLFLFMCIYFFLCIFMSFYFLLFLFISIYFFLFLFIGVYFFLFLFISLFWRKKKKIWFLSVFWLSDHPNHVVTNLLQPAPPLSLADFRMFQEPCLSQMEWNCWRIGGALDFFLKCRFRSVASAHGHSERPISAPDQFFPDGMREQRKCIAVVPIHLFHLLPG
jgi:Zn-dependent protease with chaperone function